MLRRIATMMFLLLAGIAATASSAPAERGETFVRLQVISVKFVQIGPASWGLTSGEYRVVANVVERYHGAWRPQRIVVRLDYGTLPRAGGEIFALLDRGNESVWWDTADIGLCVTNDWEREAFGPPGPMTRALDAAMRRFPCTPVGTLRFPAASGLAIKVGSRSMNEVDVRRVAESIADQSWKLYCAKAGEAACRSPADHELDMSVWPGYCLALLYTKGTMNRLGIFRCSSAYKVSLSRD